MADRKKKSTKAGAVELGKEDLEAISGGPTAVEYAVMLSVKREDKAKGDRPKGPAIVTDADLGAITS